MPQQRRRVQLDPETGEPLDVGAPSSANLTSLGGPRVGLPGVDPVTRQALPQGGRMGGAGPRARVRLDPETGDPLDVETTPDVTWDKGMNWPAMGVRVGSSLLGASGGTPGAVLGGGGELLAQLMEARLSPAEISAEATIGAFPFGRLGKSVELIRGVGMVPKAVNAATNVLGTTVKGGVAGGTAAALRPWIAENRAPTMDDIRPGVYLGAGGNLLGSSLLRSMAKFRGGAEAVEAPALRSGQGTLSEAPPASIPAPKPLAATQPRPRVSTAAPPAPWEAPALPQAGPQDPLSLLEDMFSGGNARVSQPIDLPAPAAPKPKIPAEFMAAHRDLSPQWQATNEWLRAAGVPEGIIGTPEDPIAFTRRLVENAYTPRELMGAERKVIQSVAPYKLDLLRQFFQRDEGSINPELARHLGYTAAGAVAGEHLDKEGANPWAGRIAGGGLGLVASLSRKNPRLASDISGSSLFSGKAIPKSLIGNLGSGPAWAAEISADFPKSSPFQVLKEELFNPKTTEALKEGWRKNVVREGVAQSESSPFKYAGKAIGAPDYAMRNVLGRANTRATAGNRSPIPTAGEDVGGYYTLSGDPLSKKGGQFLDLLRDWPAAEVLVPVARTATNFIERGLERTPFIGGMKSVRGWTNASDAMVKRRQAIGALAGLASLGAGAASEELLPKDSAIKDLAPFVSAAASTVGLPVAGGIMAGQQLTKALNKRRPGQRPDLGSVPLAALDALLEGTPLPSGWDMRSGDSFFSNAMRRLVPYGAAGRLVSQGLGLDPNDLDTSSSRFGAALGQVPWLNELLFERKRKVQPRVQFRPPTR